MKTIKTLAHTLTNTYRAVRLLSNPAVSAMLEKELSLNRVKSSMSTEKMTSMQSLSTNNTFFHKHYVVQITA